MKIYSDDGKLFNTVEECNIYETDLILQKAKKEAEKKEKEEKQKQLELYNKVKIKEINELLQQVLDTINEYEKRTCNKLIYDIDCFDGRLSVKETRNTLDFAWDNVIDEVFKAMHSKDICRIR
jgi:hypothetical protein